MDLLARHVFGDFGELCEEDKESNNQAVRLGGRIFSSYEVGTGVDNHVFSVGLRMSW